jgi:hypothetical protein
MKQAIEIFCAISEYCMENSSYLFRFKHLFQPKMYRICSLLTAFRMGKNRRHKCCHNHILRTLQGRAIAQAFSRRVPPRRPGFKPRSDHMGFVLNKVALGQVFSEYFRFPSQFSFHQLLQIHHHLPSGAGTIGQTVADVQSGLSVTPPQETNKQELCTFFKFQ